ncbi:MAG: DNA-processing protein DprA [Gammaproteobacteria bacterium]|nr:DNA-processing protein DprA [Gammaproteobacteria bacterium]NNC68486.1 DNA-protecting protein DprA [Gammaproteobacteria bacterium]
MQQFDAWLTLIHVDKLGPVTLQKLFAHFHSAENILQASRSELQALKISNAIIEGIHTPNKDAVQRDLAWLEHENHHLLTIQDPAYPTLLKQISDPPCVLYLLGKPELATSLLSDPQLGIVGSRNASAYGKEIATSFAQKLANSGLVITSGLASGIDGAAHRGALLSEIGTTIAVAACGLNRVYPAEHRKLAEEISQRGLIISEFPIDTSPMPGHFPRRNRIISGLSLGTLVVEASVKSGSLITARLAIDQCREVFAIPGSIHNPLSKGGHSLIRNGAKLVETVEDILEELNHQIDPDSLNNRHELVTNSEQKSVLDPQHEKILNSMGHEPISIDTLIERSGLGVEIVSSILLILELNDQVSHHGNGIYIRRNFL